jgi:hypothetical protein
MMLAMAKIPGSGRRVLAVGLLLTAFGAPVAVMATTGAADSATLAACTSGEEEDDFTTTCVPFLVPNSPDGFTTTAANPDIAEIQGVPCTGGRSSGGCIGLALEQQDMGPQPIPRSTISASP